MMERRWIMARKAGQKKSQNIFTDDGATEKVTLEYFQSKSSSTCPQSQLSLSINKDLVPGHYRFNCRISKQITSFDEQYLSHCLELIKISAAKAASFNFLVTWNPSKIVSFDGILPDEFRNNSLKNRVTSLETRSKSLILRANDDISSDAIGLASVKGSSDSLGSLGGFTMCSSPMVSSLSDLSSCVWPLVSHGTLRCTWRNGIPHFMFSLDNKREVYVTRPTKSASLGGSSSNLNWTYFIYSRTGTRKELEFCGNESNLVGRMNVSACCRKCDDESKIVETEFILYGDNDEMEREDLSYDMGKHRRLSGKVSKLFKPLHLPKHRPSNSTWGTSISLDLSSSKPEQDEDYDSDHIGRANLLDDKIPSNFELAAIVVKEQIQAPETKVGGWGLSFLERAREKQPTRDLSTHMVKVESSMDIILPAGYHGGPKIGNFGPSSLIERWRSGGQCDCSGWDTGCPLTVLNTRFHNKMSDPHSHSHCVDKSESLFLFLKGDERQGRTTSMKMVNIENGLYYIDFQSRLSPLQCFSIAVAIIHSRSPLLRPEAQTS